jgi:hypothetical protein
MKFDFNEVSSFYHYYYLFAIELVADRLLAANLRVGDEKHES